MIQIREVRPEEYATTGEVTYRAYVEHGVMDADREYARHLAEVAERAVAPTQVLVAVEDGRVLGTATWCPPGSPQQEVAGPGEGEVRMLAVVPEAARRGIARALMTHVIRTAREAGLDGIALCSATTMTPAHALYGSLGFTRTPHRDWSPVPGTDLLAYRLDLTSRPD